MTRLATHDMEVYLGKDKKCTTTDMTAIHGTVKQLTRKVKGHGRKLYMDHHFSSDETENKLLWYS
jgi:hypothetical protein